MNNDDSSESSSNSYLSASHEDEPNNERQIVVFDFDETITQNHLFKSLHPFSKGVRPPVFDKDWTINYIFGGPKRIEELKLFFKEFLLHDIDLAISSHGKMNEIVKALRFADIEPKEYFKYIHGTHDNEIWNTSLNEGNIKRFFASNKKDFIEGQLQSTDAYGHVIFIDDDEPHGRMKYYNKLSLTHPKSERRFLTRKITPIIMHNVVVGNVGKDGNYEKDESQEKGMNQEDFKKIWEAIHNFVESLYISS